MKANTDLIEVNVEPRTIKIHIIGDVHVGDAATDLKTFGKYIKAIENDDDAYVVLLGDLMNTAIPGSKSDWAMEGMPPNQQIEYCVDVFRTLAMQDKILCIIPGNHEDRTFKASGINSTEVLAIKLGIEDRYRPDFACVRIRMTNKNVSRVFNLYCTHGFSVSKAESLTYSLHGFDVVCLGHLHDPQFKFPEQRILEPSGRFHRKTMYLCVGASWMGTMSGYGMKNGYKPKAPCVMQYVTCFWDNTNRIDKRLAVTGEGLYN